MAETVELEQAHMDALLAAAEGALNAQLDFGPGIPRRIVEEAARRIEAVADLARQGISVPYVPRASLDQANESARVLALLKSDNGVRLLRDALHETSATRCNANVDTCQTWPLAEELHAALLTTLPKDSEGERG